MDALRRFNEVLARTLALTIFLFLLFSCGVKTAPVAAVRGDEVVPPALDCSPNDPACDRTDPDYKPLGK